MVFAEIIHIPLTAGLQALSLAYTVWRNLERVKHFIVSKLNEGKTAVPHLPELYKSWNYLSVCTTLNHCSLGKINKRCTFLSWKHPHLP